MRTTRRSVLQAGLAFAAGSPGVSADDERRAAVLSKEATAVIQQVAARHQADVVLACGKDDDDNIRIQLRDCDAIIRACRKQKLHKIEFRGNLTLACDYMLSTCSPNRPPQPGIQTGPVSVDRWVAAVNAWVDGMKEAGFAGVDIVIGFYPWGDSDKASLDKIEKAIERIRLDGLRLGFYAVPHGNFPDFESIAKASVNVWTMLAQRFRPEVFAVTHEPVAVGQYLTPHPTLEQYTEFVKRTAAAVKKVSPKTVVGAGVVPCTAPQELPYAQKWVTVPEMEFVAVDFYELRGFDRTNKAVAMAKAAGKRTFIEETWRVAYWPKEAEKQFPNNQLIWMAAGIGMEKYHPVDAKWIEMAAVYAAAWGMDAISPFWSQTLFKYLKTDDWKETMAYGPEYNSALEKALLKGERSPLFYDVKKLIRELGKPGSELA